MTAVRATGVVKRFETTCALDQVDLAVGEGETLGLLGPNGAGKTTLLRILFGLVQADAGSVEIFGSPIEAHDASALADVADFVEEPAFYPYLSGLVNLELLAELDRRPARVSPVEALERVGLGDRGGERVAGYSTGMRQRLGIAASLLSRPRLLLLDEPTSGLDPGGVREVRELVRSLATDGAAIVLSSHQIGEIEGVCDRFTVLRRGCVAWEGSSAELRAAAPASDYRLSTSDDPRALEIAAGRPAIEATLSPQDGVLLSIDEGDLDGFVLALGAAGVAVRRLELRTSPLESMFFALTGDGEAQ